LTNEQYELSRKLKCVYNSRNKIKALECELEQIHCITQKITPDYTNDGSQRGSNKNSTEDRVIEYLTKSENLCKEIFCEKIKVIELIEKVKKIISIVDDAGLYSVLSLSYISCKTNEQIAEEINCDERTVRRKRNIALDKILEKCPCMSGF